MVDVADAASFPPNPRAKRPGRSQRPGRWTLNSQLCGIPLPELLNASHILPWSEYIPRRAAPRNTLAMPPHRHCLTAAVGDFRVPTPAAAAVKQ